MGTLHPTTNRTGRTQVGRGAAALGSRLPCLLVLLARLAAADPAPGPVTPLEKVVVVEAAPGNPGAADLSAFPPSQDSTARLADQMANFFVAASDARSFNDVFSVRGLANTPIFGSPALTVYLDGMPLGSAFTFPSQLDGFSRAELHRGPGQNTLFGYARPAGVLELTTPEPGPTATGEARASFGRFNARDATLSASSAAQDRADAYVNLSSSARDGYITNTVLNRDIDGKRARSALGRVRFRPTPTAEFTVLATALRARDGSQPLVPLGGPLFAVTRHSEGETSVDAFNVALGAAFQLPAGRLTATTSTNRWELGPYASVLAFGPDELSSFVQLKQRNWNEEIQFAADPRADIRWQGGLFYSDHRTDGAFTRLFGPATYEQSTYRLGEHDLAAFGEAAFPVTPALKFTSGLRLEGTRQVMDRNETVPVPQVFHLRSDSTALLPKLAASYTLDPDTRLSLSLSAGYKPGGFSAFTGNRSLAAFGPERTVAGEAAVSRRTADQRVTVTGRVFWYEITGYQIERSFATSAVSDDYLVVNAPRARSYGGELEFRWVPFEGLSLAMDLGTTRATLREFKDPYTGADYSGSRAPFVPAYDGSVRLDYRFRTHWFVSVDLTVNGRTFYTEAEDPTFAQDDVTVLAARLGYDAGNWRVMAYGDNLGDRQYYSSITPGTFHGSPAAPRTFGLELTVKWGAARPRF